MFAVSRCTAATTPSPPRSPAAPTPADAAIRWSAARDVSGLQREVERLVSRSSLLDHDRAPSHVLAENLDRLACDLRRRRRLARAMQLRVPADTELEEQRAPIGLIIVRVIGLGHGRPHTAQYLGGNGSGYGDAKSAGPEEQKGR